jgi:hypothetical protein
MIFFGSIEGLLQRDGWTCHEAYEDVLKYFSGLRQRGLDQMKGEERVSFERQTR